MSRSAGAIVATVSICIAVLLSVARAKDERSADTCITRRAMVEQFNHLHANLPPLPLQVCH